MKAALLPLGWSPLKLNGLDCHLFQEETAWLRDDPATDDKQRSRQTCCFEFGRLRHRNEFVCDFMRTVLTPVQAMGLAVAWMEAILMALVCGLVFLQLGKDQAGIRSREAAQASRRALQSP